MDRGMFPSDCRCCWSTQPSSIVSSITIELTRREITGEAALAPVQSIPGVSLADERHFPWLAVTPSSVSCFLQTMAAGIRHRHDGCHLGVILCDER